MNRSQHLLLIKAIHTFVWVFFNIVIFYLVYAVAVNKIDVWLWICLGLIFLEGLVLLFFKNVCPVTLIAKKYSDSRAANFDIFLPEWLARYNKQIYSAIVLLTVLVLIFRLI